MLEGGIIAKLLEEKWKTFAQVRINVILTKNSSFFLFRLHSFFAGNFLQADVCDTPPSVGHVCCNLFQVFKRY